MAGIHNDLFTQIVTWAKTPPPRTPRSLFLYGPPGIGKSTLARAALETADYRVVEWNASSHRHKAAVEESLIPLLNSRNVADFFRPEGPRYLGVILDEIDGMSVGDKGGLTELIRILKEYNGNNAIICISNEWMEKKFQPFQKICTAHAVHAPSQSDVLRLLELQFPKDAPYLNDLAKDLLEVHSGDLRKILQSVKEISTDIIAGRLDPTNVRLTITDGLLDAHALGSNKIRRSETIKSAVAQLLRGELDLTAEIPLNNNDLNLAGLHLHETLPKWIKRYVGNNQKGYDMYIDAFRTLLNSDRLDYYTFFFQHWTLFSITYQAKLQGINTKLFGCRGVEEGTSADWKDDDNEYTSVLSKQSMLYNQFRYLNEMRDLCASVDPTFDSSFESTFWKANLYLTAAKHKLQDPATPGHAKRTIQNVWENNEFWRATLPTWFPSADTLRFMRLLQALEIPRAAKITAWT
jgi:DNA polymerase III delta prime subunit